MNSSTNSHPIEPTMDSFTNKNILKDNMNNGFLNERDSRRGLFDEMKRVEEESLVSTKETLGLILESEKIGVKTGRELVRQRETLNRVEDKLVSIDGSLDETQKHLKSIKSVFGGFRELFSKKKSINNNINKSVNESEFLEELDTYEVVSMNSVKDFNKSDSNGKTYSVGFDETDSTSPTANIQNAANFLNESKQTNDKIEDNLNQIDMGIERLKQLSLGLGNEIDSQNSLIDRISKQTEKAEIRVKEQNQQMTRILRK